MTTLTRDQLPATVRAIHDELFGQMSDDEAATLWDAALAAHIVAHIVAGEEPCLRCMYLAEAMAEVEEEV